MSEARARVALLTGCAGGIGAGIARALAERGYRLMLTDINESALRQQNAGFDPKQVEFASLDVRNENAWRDVLAKVQSRWGHLDYLFNIAGYLKPGHAHASPPIEINKHMEINAIGSMLGTRLAAEIMVSQGHGHIINIASLAAVAPAPGLAFYTASKFALRGFSLAIAQELRPHGVAVTVVCPDAVKTAMLDLQLDYPEAALTFSGPGPLTVDTVVRVVVNRVMTHKPIEVIIPFSRGLLAKLVSAVPILSTWLGDHLRRKGLARLKEMADARENNK